MRLLKQHDRWVPQFTQVWEVAHLEEHGDEWIPFCRIGQQDPIGSIHAQTHEIRLHDHVVLVHREVVALAAPRRPTSL
jgi:hypothetical protein